MYNPTNGSYKHQTFEALSMDHKAQFPESLDFATKSNKPPAPNREKRKFKWRDLKGKDLGS